MLKVIRPIVFFDLETTGVDTENDRIVQISGFKINSNGERFEFNTYVNPGVPIPKEASDVHGITDDMVKNSITFEKLSKRIYEIFHGCDVGGFNSDGFDIPLLCAEMKRAGIEFMDWDYNLIDVMKLYRHLYPNSLGDIYKRLLGKDIENAHDAASDVSATVEILDFLVDKIEQKSVEEIDLMLQGEKKRCDLAGKIYFDGAEYRWSFGKNVGRPVNSDYGFAAWVLKNNFPEDTKNWVNKLINR